MDFNYTNGSLTLNTKLCLVNDATWKRMLRVMAYLLVLLVSLLGNTMTVIIVKKVQNSTVRRTFAHIFLANLAMADLVITVVYMPRMIVRMFHGKRWVLAGDVGLASCRGVVFLHHTAILVAVFSIFLITLDRFCAVLFPLKRILTKRLVVGLLCATWIVAGALRSPFLMIPQLTPSNLYKLVCSPLLDQLLGEYLSLYRTALAVVYWFCLALTILLYTIIIFHLLLKKNPGISTDTTSARQQKAGRKLLKMLICITSAYCVFWSLYFLAIPLYGSHIFPCELSFIRFFLAHLNCAVNPCLLAYFDVNYRQGYKDLLKRCLPRKLLDESGRIEMRQILGKTRQQAIIMETALVAEREILSEQKTQQLARWLVAMEFPPGPLNSRSFRQL